jgi:hypothetical protein
VACQTRLAFVICEAILFLLLILSAVRSASQNPDPATAAPEPATTEAGTAVPPHNSPTTVSPKKREPRLTPRQKRNMEKAEALAQRTLQRLKETMDVETVYREVGVPDAIWRYRIAQPNLFSQLSDELRDGCDDANIERYALAMADLMWISLSYAFTTQDISKLNDIEPIRKAVPPDVYDIMHQTRFFAKLGDSLDMPSINSREELLQMIDEAKKVHDVVATHVNTSDFQGKRYADNLKYFAKDGDHVNHVTTDTEHLYRQDKEVEIYVVWADFVPLAIVDDNGEFRLLSIAD